MDGILLASLMQNLFHLHNSLQRENHIPQFFPLHQLHESGAQKIQHLPYQLACGLEDWEHETHVHLKQQLFFLPCLCQQSFNGNLLFFCNCTAVMVKNERLIFSCQKVWLIKTPRSDKKRGIMIVIILNFKTFSIIMKFFNHFLAIVDDLYWFSVKSLFYTMVEWLNWVLAIVIWIMQLYCHNG